VKVLAKVSPKKSKENFKASVKIHKPEVDDGGSTAPTSQRYNFKRKIGAAEHLIKIQI
jgi:hypothetical protein